MSGDSGQVLGQGARVPRSKPTVHTVAGSAYRVPQDTCSAGARLVRSNGLEAGQPVMVAVIEPKIDRLRAELGDDADRVVFVDMAALGGNPATAPPGDDGHPPPPPHR